MNKRICIFGIFLFLIGIMSGGTNMTGDVLITVGPVVIVIGALIDEQKAKD
ncbi:unnamed protein product [marine sediment metagenome]|uniref:Uncharacterized protein n=1 Tax=marine sediment metagenome TaxID=412755 RepID=X1JUV4_9ZZZZ